MRPFLAKGVLVVSAALLAGVSTDAGGAPGRSDEAPSAAGAATRGSANRFYAPGDRAHSFYFTRVAYSSGFGRRGRGGGSWATDYPKADQQFLVVLQRLTNLDAFPYEHPVQLDDPELRRYPFIYSVEVGAMELSEAEVTALRGFIDAGGFMVADDFWGSYEWANFERQMQRVFPEYPVVEIPKDHAIYRAFYDVDSIIQVPNVQNGMNGWQTHEQDGYVPHLRGIFDDEGRLLVAINWNTDLGDAWEWAEQAAYPLKFSTYAYRMGVNFIVYAMSH